MSGTIGAEITMWKGTAAVAIVCMAGSIACSRPAGRRANLSAAEVALNNRAVGLMGQYEFGQAQQLFSQLAGAHPEHSDLHVNLAIATLHRQHEGDGIQAQRTLEQVVASDAAHLRARYNLGLLLLHDGRAADALPHLAFAAEHAPADAFAQYFLAQARFQQSQFAEALAGYDRSFAIDPRLRSAAYGGFQSRQRLGRADAQQMLDAFRALESNPQSEVAEFKYTRLGPLAEAVTIDQGAVAETPRPPGPTFEPATMQIDALPAGVSWRRSESSRPITITAADIDGDGRIDLFLAGAIIDRGSVHNAVLLNRGDLRFTLDRSHPLAAVDNVTAVLWGDVDNDGVLDAYLCRTGPNQLWRQTAAGQWSAVGPAAHVDGGGGTTVDGALLDADHDGDLDVLLVKASGGDELLNNNGDGTFRPLGATIGLATNVPASGIALADVDADRDADILILRTTPPHQLLVNDRMWRYHSDARFNPVANAQLAAAVFGDLDADGRPEIYASDAQGIVRWSRASATSAWESRRVADSAALANAKQLALSDVDGDGQIDLIGSTTEQRWRAVSIAPDGRAVSLFAAEGPPLATWTVAQLETSRGPSVIGMPIDSDRGPALWRPGAGRFPFVTVHTTGRDARSRQIRSNVSGIGTKIAARTGSRWTTVDTYRMQSGVGQSLQPIAIGTGGAAQIDFVALVWSDGVLQSEVGLPAGAVQTIAETERQLSSCPVLFAFDGSRFTFVTDLLGVGGIGTPIAPNVYAAPRPRESVLLPAGLPASQRDRFSLKIVEPMEEVAYIDSVRLAAYDLPPGWQMALDERQSTAAPPPTGAPRFFREERTPSEATVRDAGGVVDVTAAIATLDTVAASPGRVDPRHVGRTDGEHILELRFDRPLEDRPGALLVADGWVEYPYAQTLFAAWQGGAAYREPAVEAQGSDRRWHPVSRARGYPAGMPRRLSIPLEPLPGGTTALRLRTTLEIYWDRLAVAYAATNSSIARHELALTAARVARSGFPLRSMNGQRRPSYDYDRRTPLWDVRYASGFYTAEGDATDLLEREDGAVAIIGPGEELHLEFADKLPALPAGWTRRFVIDARGWCKDMDLYTKDGDTVEPLPGVRSAAAQELQRRYTTRYQSGR